MQQKNWKDLEEPNHVRDAAYKRHMIKQAFEMGEQRDQMNYIIPMQTKLQLQLETAKLYVPRNLQK